MDYEFKITERESGEQAEPQKEVSLEDIVKRYKELEKQKEGILVWKDITSADRELLKKIEIEMEDLKKKFNEVGKSMRKKNLEQNK